MKKTLTGAIAIALFAVAGVASAANFSNVEFDNGDVEIQGMGGETVTATFRLVIPAGEVVEYIQTDVLGDSLAPKCESVGGSKGLQEGTHFVDMDVKLPPNTGTYDLKVQGSGIFGGLRAIDCESNVVDTSTFNDALRVVGSDEDSDSNVGGGSIFGMSFDQFLAALKTALGLDKPEPTKPAFCASMPMYNGANASAVQAWLMSNGFSAGFYAAGVYAPTGYWGPVSTTAYNSALAQCN